MSKEATKLKDLIHSDDSVAPDPLHSDAEKLRAWMQENIGGLQSNRTTTSYALEFLKTLQSKLLGYQEERMRALSGLSALEHEVAEAAIIWITCDIINVVAGNTEELDKAGELLIDATEKLIKFKEELKSHGHGLS